MTYDIRQFLSSRGCPSERQRQRQRERERERERGRQQLA